ncbi:hypothetical protein [Streptomyces sp. NPDC057554]|uniref:hypothetical protein n=1 Tax=Streptomyces sp. NPDC057554 TaxID=3350538 RepID=UPI0036810A66
MAEVPEPEPEPGVVAEAAVEGEAVAAPVMEVGAAEEGVEAAVAVGAVVEAAVPVW